MLKNHVDVENKEIVLKEGGDTCCVRVGNTVIDIMHGFCPSKIEPCAIISIHKHDIDSEIRTLVYYDDKIIFYG